VYQLIFGQFSAIPCTMVLRLLMVIAVIGGLLACPLTCMSHGASDGSSQPVAKGCCSPCAGERSSPAPCSDDEAHDCFCKGAVVDNSRANDVERGVAHPPVSFERPVAAFEPLCVKLRASSAPPHDHHAITGRQVRLVIESLLL
jgi:hypothetical protein